MTPAIHMYKLTTSETIICKFYQIDEIAKGVEAFIISDPRVVTESAAWDGELSDWVPFVIDFDKDKYPLPKSMVVIGFEEARIDPFLLEVYLGYSEDD